MATLRGFKFRVYQIFPLRWPLGWSIGQFLCNHIEGCLVRKRNPIEQGDSEESFVDTSYADIELEAVLHVEIDKKCRVQVEKP